MEDQFENNSQEEQVPVPPGRLSSRVITMAILLFVLIVLGMFAFAYLKNQELKDEVVEQPIEEPVDDVKYAAITRVDAKHYYEDGVHTLVGEIPMPTPCDLLVSEAVVMESYPERIAIDFSVINNANFCAEVITPQRFKVSATASEDATFSAKFMDRQIELNLIPAEEGEVPDDFELFIKG